MDRYCSSVVHLLRDREFGKWSYQNAFNGNIRRCSKHRRVKIIVLMMIILMNVDCYSLLRAKVRFVRLMMRYITKLLNIHKSLYEDYIPSILLKNVMTSILK